MMAKRSPWRLPVLAAACVLTAGCAAGLHGSFVAHSWHDPATRESAELLGDVEGRSCQVKVLYIFGWDEPASTDAAIRDAKSKYPGTTFLADISIDTEEEWRFLYGVLCVVARAQAYR